MKKLIIFFSFLILSNSLFAQYEIDDEGYVNSDPSISAFSIKEKIYVGSGINLNFWGNTLFFYIAPLIGYELTDKFSVGFSTMYQYQGNQFAKFNSIGGGTFLRFRPIEQLILETSFNLYNTKQKTPFIEKYPAKSFMGGIGYARPLSNRNYYQLMLQYDFLRDLNVPEPSIQITQNNRIYFKFAFIFYLS